MLRFISSFLLTLSFATPALAQTSSQPAIDVDAFRASIAAVKFDTSSPFRDSSPAAARAPRREMGVGTRIAITSLAGLGGFFAGGYIGSRIDGGCNGCDDPGLVGALVGIPIGTAAAAITAWILTGK